MVLRINKVRYSKVFLPVRLLFNKSKGLFFLVKPFGFSLTVLEEVDFLFSLVTK